MSRLPLRFEANAGQWDPRVRFVTHGNDTTLFITDDAMTITLRNVPPRSPGASRDEERRAPQMALAGAKTAAVTMRLVGAQPSVPVGEVKIETKSNFFVGSDPTKWRTNVANFAEVRAKDWVPGVDVVWHGGHDGLEYDLEVAAGTDASQIALDVEGATALAISNDGALEIETPAGTLVQRPPRVTQDGRELRTRYRLDGARRVAFEMDSYERGRAVLIDPALVYSTYLGGTAMDFEGNRGPIAVDANGNVYIAGMTLSSDFPLVGPLQGASAGSEDVFVAKLSATGASLDYSTYLGGTSDDECYDLAVDGNGAVHVVGSSWSSDFPRANAYQNTFGGTRDAFVAKLSSTGSALLYSTYLGGSNNDTAWGVAIGVNGSAYVAGGTSSTDFPTTLGAYQTTVVLGGGPFVTELSVNGSTLVYSTFVGALATASAIALDATGAAYITGDSYYNTFPMVNPFQATNAGNSDVVVTKLNPSGSALAYSTYLGGSSSDHGYGIAVDTAGAAYVTGSTSSVNFPTANAYLSAVSGLTDRAFVTKLTSSGSALDYSTYLGPSTGSIATVAYDIAVDASGSALVTGKTGSAAFPVFNPLQATIASNTWDAFVTKFTPVGSTLAFSTYLGGTGVDMGYGVVVDPGGATYVAGVTVSTNFPTAAAYQASNAGNMDIFITKITDGPVALGVSPSPASVAPKGSKTFTAYGGSGSGYAFSLSTNASGGSINPSTGAYTAGSTPNVTDVVQVTDSVSSVATANVNVGAGVSVSPSSPAPAPKATVNFVATGGSGAGFSA